MELIFPLIIIVVVIFLIIKVFSGGKKAPDKYVVIQERETRVRNHIVKVPGGKKKRKR